MADCSRKTGLRSRTIENLTDRVILRFWKGGRRQPPNCDSKDVQRRQRPVARWRSCTCRRPSGLLAMPGKGEVYLCLSYLTKFRSNRSSHFL